MKRLTAAAFLLFVFSASFAGSSVQLRLEKGKTYLQVSTTNSKISQLVQGMNMDMEMDVASTTNFKVLDVKDTLFVIEATMSKIMTTTKSPMGVQEFSSDSKNVNDLTSMLLAELSKSPFKVTLTRSGKVAEIDINTAIDKAVNSVVTLSEDQKVTLKTLFKGQFGDDNMRQTIENAFAYYPPKSVKGEKWTSNLKLKSMIVLEQQNQNEVTDVTAESVTVKYAGEMATPENAEPALMNGMSAKYAISGTTEGTAIIDLKTGWVIKNTAIQAMKGNVEILPNAQLPDGVQFPMTVNTTITVTQ
ncbi:DUF6263 family protein [uncultured Acetobacteroides sp.]|uniref:DUF6263 family protein n=1 Tax=uncultured Acetobacteroides sp. TaxID=1760811 RepID=UPI0029F4BA8A|nr:DUF6263 family protein [uncultured Acetobacteroides sp.]